MSKKPSLVINPPFTPKVKRRPVLLRGILGSTLEKYGLDKKLVRYQFILRWEEIVGAEVAKRARPDSLRHTTLIVRVSSSAWAQELSFQKHVLLGRLKKLLDDPDLITDIAFVTGEEEGTALSRF